MFWEDHYRKNPTEARRTADGKEVQFVTGDPLLDKWEDEIARGLDPDLTEGLSPEARAKEKKAKIKIEDRLIKQELEAALGDGFSEDYGAM
jgi:hypothetical protein